MTNPKTRLLQINKYLFILGFIFLAIFVMAFLLLITHVPGIELTEKPVEEKTMWYFLVAILMAPFIETYLFQKLPIDFFRDSFKKDWPLVLISAIPFGLIHYIQAFFVRDILYALCIGAVFAYAYILAKKREDLNAYLAVVLIHAGYNLSGVIIHLIVD